MYKNKRLKGTKELVRDILNIHPDWNAKQVYDRYLIVVGHPNKAVTLNAIQKHCKSLRGPNQTVESKGYDKPWQLGSLNDCPLPPESIPYIMAVNNWAGKQKERFTEAAYPPVTIRQAKWISYLQPIYVMLKPKRFSWLWGWSKAYAVKERLHEMENEEAGEGKKAPFDTTELDEAMYSGDTVETFGDMFMTWTRDPSKIGIMEAVGDPPFPIEGSMMIVEDNAEQEGE